MPQMQSMPQLSEKVRAARQAKGLTIEALAFSAGVSVASVNRTEAGRHEPSLRTLTAIASALGVPVADLLPTPSGRESDEVRS